MMARGPQTQDGRSTIVAGTRGLAAFAHPEIEYGATADAPDTIVPHAMAIADYLLVSGKTLKDGDTLGADGGKSYAISAQTQGMFVEGPVLKLQKN